MIEYNLATILDNVRNGSIKSVHLKIAKLLGVLTIARKTESGWDWETHQLGRTDAYNAFAQIAETAGDRMIEAHHLASMPMGQGYGLFDFNEADAVRINHDEQDDDPNATPRTEMYVLDKDGSVFYSVVGRTMLLLDDATQLRKDVCLAVKERRPTFDTDARAVWQWDDPSEAAKHLALVELIRGNAPARHQVDFFVGAQIQQRVDKGMWQAEGDVLLGTMLNIPLLFTIRSGGHGTKNSPYRVRMLTNADRLFAYPFPENTTGVSRALIGQLKAASF